MRITRMSTRDSSKEDDNYNKNSSNNNNNDSDNKDAGQVRGTRMRDEDDEGQQ